MDDVSYFSKRAADELRLAQAATSESARAAHRELALRYRDLAGAIEAHQVIVGNDLGLRSDDPRSA